MNESTTKLFADLGITMMASVPMTPEVQAQWEAERAKKKENREHLQQMIASGEQPYKGGRTLTLLLAQDYEDVSIYGLVKGKTLEGEVWEAILDQTEPPDSLDWKDRENWKKTEVRRIVEALGFQWVPFKEA